MYRFMVQSCVNFQQILIHHDMSDISVSVSVQVVDPTLSLRTTAARRSGELACVESHFVLISFEVTTVTSMDSQEPTCCGDGPAGFLTK